jgi:hypothetical protein
VKPLPEPATGRKMMNMAARLLTVLGGVLLALHLSVSPAVAACAPLAADPPSGLPQATVQALGVRDTYPATVAGIHGFRMHLWVKGDIYAMPGGDKTVVAILKDRMWVPSLSVMFRSGPFILFAPTFLGIPNAVLAPGKQNEMEPVDPMMFICHDKSIPGPRLC